MLLVSKAFICSLISYLVMQLQLDYSFLYKV